ncbi:MAG: hypothetical protein KDE53_31510 [Caldilineaceae bacterium]|nr:hypothetical protein [Caldilineaceae bacterium]
MKLLRVLRVISFVVVGLMLLIKAVSAEEAFPNQPLGGTIPPLPPLLTNPDFECTVGYVPQLDAKGREIFVPAGWQLTTLLGTPVVHSARIFFAKSCEGSAHVEKISGIDSIVIRAEDLETPPEPGKPFDVTFHQQISVTVGGAYSLSGWMLSLCGGSAVPSDCPDGVYMAKRLGIDPTGGIDPNGENVVWIENRHNFWENGQRVGWQQMSVSALAQAETLTLFARISSPQRWHGNHAFIDALSLVRAPLALLNVPTAVTGTVVTLQWQGQLFPEITEQSGSTHELLFDIAYRHEKAEAWQPLAIGQRATDTLVFTANCVDTNYLFRIRARAEQPDAGEGAWPNHRYLGLWSDPVTVRFLRPTAAMNGAPSSLSNRAEHLIYLPLLANQKSC